MGGESLVVLEEAVKRVVGMDVPVCRCHVDERARVAIVRLD